MLYVLNHKNHFTKEELLLYKKEIDKYPKNDQVVFAPVSCYLSYFEGYPLASQDISYFDIGSSTGEIAPSILKSLGVSYSIIGHSERRKYFQEDNAVITRKMQAALQEDITPILCIGEEKEAYLHGTTIEVLKQQLEVLSHFPQALWKKIVIAYEPIWAIGSGITLSKETLKKIVEWMKEETGCTILYGGSVDLDMISSFKEIKELDGFLIGGMSLKIEKVIQLIQENRNK